MVSATKYDEYTSPAQALPMVAHETARKFILIWLGSVAFLVINMIILGAVTRLTESGLSMVDWRPITGLLPPLTEAAWLAEFERYRAFPEYQLINRGMSLDEYKLIFYFEYGHRMLGRLIGLVYALPLFYVLWQGWARPDLRNRLIVLLFLGGMQGVIGWWMVKSGLVDKPDVSHFRLAAHLSLALIIVSYIYWIWLSLYKRTETFTRLPLNWGTFLTVAVFAQIITGAFVAGLSAGEVYNTWPLMDGRFFPKHYWFHDPVWRAPIEHITAIQFNHRMGAYVLLGLFLYTAYTLRKTDDHRWGILLTAAVLIQAILGVITLVLVVPISLGALHQLGAVFVLLVTVGYWHHLVYGEALMKLTAE